MRFFKACIGLALLLGMVACGGGGGSSTPANSGGTTPTPTLVSISVTPANPSITIGATQAFTATGAYSDNSTQNLTASVTWSSSNTSVATISNSGIATSVGVGATTIKALSGNISGTATLTVVAAQSAGANVMQVTVNGALCSAATSANYPNKPCVSVTVCAPGSTTNCQTITDILLDTGSYGLRIFNSLLTTVTLTPVASGSGQLAECVNFGDGASEWGPVETASVILGNEPAVRIPIHVVNSSFATPPSACDSRHSTPDTSPSEAGFNGILGVGLFAQDCGSFCTTTANNGNYYSCNGTTCTGTTVPNANQVINPVAALPVDNNGVLVQLPSVALGGVASVNGSLILGIGTQTNNQPTTVTGYPADPTVGNFTTSFNGQTFTDASFLDSGSNALFFDDPAITQCSSSSSGSGYFCESPTTEFSATNSGYLGTPSGPVSFETGNATTLFNTSNNVFIELGGPGQGFDWGLPFFFGRNIFVGIYGTSSTLGAGPYWAY